MAVSVDDVRIRLNDISHDVLADTTIQSVIDETTYFVDSAIGTTVVDPVFKDYAIKLWVSLKCFTVAYLFDTVKVGDVQTQRKLENVFEQLRSETTAALRKIGLPPPGEVADETIIDYTGTWDHREEDPDLGESVVVSVYP